MSEECARSHSGGEVLWAALAVGATLVAAPADGAAPEALAAFGGPPRRWRKGCACFAEMLASGSSSPKMTNLMKYS